MKELPDFYRVDRTASNNLVDIPASAVQQGDFVLIEARLDLVNTIDQVTQARETSVEYGMEKVVRLYTQRELQVSTYAVVRS